MIVEARETYRNEIRRSRSYNELYLSDAKTRLADIFDSMPFSRIVSMYKIYHEMDISRFIEYAVK